MEERVLWRHPPTEVHCAQPLQVMPRAQAQLLLRTRHSRSTQRATVISCLMRSLFRDIPVAIYSESAVTLFGTEHFPEL